MLPTTITGHTMHAVYLFWGAQDFMSTSFPLNKVNPKDSWVSYFSKIFIDEVSIASFDH
jgi:hypothetical protein